MGIVFKTSLILAIRNPEAARLIVFDCGTFMGSFTHYVASLGGRGSLALSLSVTERQRGRGLHSSAT